MNYTNLENIYKFWKKTYKNEEDFNAYNLCKLVFKNIYDKNVEGAKIRRKREWYQHGEKLTRKSYF